MRTALTHSLLAVSATAVLGGALRADLDRQNEGGPKTKAAVVTITAMDYAFQAPDTIAAGRTTLRLVNKGPDFHHVWLVKLEQGKTMADLVAASKNEGPLPKWAVEVGGPNSPMPGGENAATLELEPGRYVMACVIPAKTDGKPHFMKGMVKELTVTPVRGVQQAGKEVAPPADVVMTLSDYKFDVSSPITTATRTIRIRNTAAQSHEAVIVKLAPNTSVQQFLEKLEKPQGPPPGALVGGITGITKGRTVDITTSFTPGEYALICFIPDAADGKPHLMHGMTRQFTVK